MIIKFSNFEVLPFFSKVRCVFFSRKKYTRERNCNLPKNALCTQSFICLEIQCASICHKCTQGQLVSFIFAHEQTKIHGFVFSFFFDFTQIYFFFIYNKYKYSNIDNFPLIAAVTLIIIICTLCTISTEPTTNLNK